MSKKILFNLLLLALIISFSCSKNEDIKKLSSTEITNFLLVNEQLPIKTLSNALQWPEDIILGVDLGLIKLNEDGEEKLNEILEDYSEDGKDYFIKDNNEKEWSEFVKGNWIKSEAKKISISKLNEIKVREFKNNAIIQNKLNSFIPSYIERQTEELSRYQFNFFSKGFWKNLGQISWMHIRSTSGKISNRDVNYLKSNYVNELEVEWQSKFYLYFSAETAKTERGNILSIYQNLNIIKYKYLSKLNNKKFEPNSFIPNSHNNITHKSKINIRPIINQFNLTMIDNFGQLFIDLFIGLLISTLVNYVIMRITNEGDIISRNIVVTFFNTGISPFKFVIGTAAYLGNIIVTNNMTARIQSIKSILNKIIGLILIVLSYWLISKKQNEIEKEINNNFKTDFTSSFDKTSIQVLDDLNLNTELFFTSI
jgi:hypothetical protein